jgi:hypothetical protein
MRNAELGQKNGWSSSRSIHASARSTTSRPGRCRGGGVPGARPSSYTSKPALFHLSADLTITSLADRS